MKRTIYATNNEVSLVEYLPCDSPALFEDWHDPDTNRGYNGFYTGTFDEFCNREVRQRFFASIQLNSTGEIIGAIGISPPDTEADLAIWVFRRYRRKGHGTSAFRLATEYATSVLGITELHAGAYQDNIGSRKILKRCGYIPYPAGDSVEKHYQTGEVIIQLDHIFVKSS